MSDESTTFGEEFYGRDVAVRIDPPEADPGIGQFCVTLLVDGKERWSGYFTDKRDG